MHGQMAATTCGYPG